MEVRNYTDHNGKELKAVNIPMNESEEGWEYFQQLSDEQKFELLLALLKDLNIVSIGKFEEVDMNRLSELLTALIERGEEETEPDEDWSGLLLKWCIYITIAVGFASLVYHASTAAIPAAKAAGKVIGEGLVGFVAIAFLLGVSYLVIWGIIQFKRKATLSGNFKSSDRRENNVNFNINFDQNNY